MRTIEVEVTQRDIVQGLRCDIYRCPVANAIERALPPEIVSSVLGYAALINGEAIDLPPHVTDWIEDFDNGKPVSPTSFTIELPED